MPLDSSLLYGEMVASWILHACIPLAVGLGIQTVFSLMIPGYKVLMLLGFTVAISFLIQMGLLTSLQASSCSGVQDVGAIAFGALESAGITAVMGAIPLFVKIAREAVSHLFIQSGESEFVEQMIGMAYWCGFAGAYGIGIGSMTAAKCKASS
jgi:hypothetical protein